MSCADSLTMAFTKEKIAKYVGEFIGTAWLVLIISLSVGLQDEFGLHPSLTIGLGLMCIIYTYGYISYAHYNPSITLAFTIRNIDEWPRSDYAQIIIYYIVEYLGGITGGLLGWAIGGKNAAYPYPKVGEDSSQGQAFMAELIFTFILASLILHVATDKRQAKNQFYGLAIGMVVTTSIVCIGKVSGCCLNSAVYLGLIIPAVFASLNPDNPDIDLSDCWIYIIAPFVGGALAALHFNCVFDKGSRSVSDDKCVSFSSFSKELRTIKDTAQNEIL